MKIQGIIPPMLTPMHADESINEKELRNQVNRLIGAGVHGLFPGGTNSENYALSEEEKERVLAIVIEETAGRVPIYAGTGNVTTRDTIALSQKAKALGADVLSVITPWFAAASQEELYQHYAALARAVDLPILLYNIPVRTGNSLAPATVERLSRIESIVGVKDSCGDFLNMLHYMECTKGRDFAVVSGNDALIYWNLAAGGAGAVSGCSNLFPGTVVGIYEHFMAGDMEKSQECQALMGPLRESFRWGNMISVIKAAMEMQGYPVGKCRAPFSEIKEGGREAIEEMLKTSLARGAC